MYKSLKRNFKYKYGELESKMMLSNDTSNELKRANNALNKTRRTKFKE